MIGRLQPRIDHRAHRADEARLLAPAIGDVGIAEKEGVIGEQRRDQVQLLELGDLVGADELAVDADRAAVLGRIIARHLAVQLDQVVDRGIAIGVDHDLQVVVVAVLRTLLHQLGRDARTAGVARLARRAALEIGGGEPRRAPLRRAVGGDLAPADLEAIAVAAETGGRVVLEDRLEIGDEGIGHDIDEQAALVGNALELGERRHMGRAFLRGGDPGSGIDHLPLLRRLHFVSLSGDRQLGDHRDIGGFHDQALQRLAVILAQDHAAFGRRHPVGVAEFFHRLGVDHRAVHRDVDDADRIVGEGRIEHVAGEHLAAGHQVLVIAIAEQQLARLQALGLRALLQLGDDRVGIRRRTGRRGRDIDAVAEHQRVDEVAVRVDKAGQHQLAAQILDLGSGDFQLHRLGIAADKHDLALVDHHGLGIGGRIALHRQDRAAMDDEIGALRVRARIRTSCKAQGQTGRKQKSCTHDDVPPENSSVG